MYSLYIGSPNTTHQMDDETLRVIKELTSKYFESYTYLKARGVYKDTEEDTLILTIAKATKADVYALGEEIRAFLKQDSVAVEHNGEYERLITK